MKELLKSISSCSFFKKELDLGCNPIVAAHPKARVIIIGQALGTKVHNTPIPWNGKNGIQLRKWQLS